MGKSAPRPPDPVELIDAQSEANRLNIYSPQGANIYGTLNAAGEFVPDSEGRAALMVEETPFQRALREAQQGIATDLTGVAGQRVQGLSPDALDLQNIGPEYQFQLDRGGLPALQALGTDGLMSLPQFQRPDVSDDQRDRVEKSVRDRYTRLLAPQQKQQQERVSQNLQNRGIPIGSEAYNREMNRLAQQQSQQSADIADRAIEAGRRELDTERRFALQSQAQEFGQAARARGIGFGEQQAQVADALRRRGILTGERQQDMALANQARARAQQESLTGRQQRIAELAQLLGAAPQQPVAGLQVQPPQLDVLGPQAAAFQQQQQNYLANLQGLYGLGSAAATVAGARLFG